MKPGIMGPQPVLSTTYGTPLQSKPLGHQMPSLSVSLYLCLFIESSLTISWSGFAMTVSGARTWRLRKRMCTASDSPVSKQQVRIQTQAFRSKASALSLCQMSCYESTKISTRTYGNNYRGPQQQLRSQPATSQWGTPINLGGRFHFLFAFQF